MDGDYPNGKAMDGWTFILFPKPGVERPKPSKEEHLAQVKNFIGDDTIPAKILDISQWTINEIVAEEYSRDNVFCLGDAVHRHPPFNGLGSNSRTKDAFNLAWKIANVLKGYASSNLLSTFSIEPQPVSQSIITRANTSFREHSRIWEVLMYPEELSDRFYTGPGVYAADEPVPFALEGHAAEDPVLHYMPSTYPGKRLPHVWLNKRCPVDVISTVDLAGKGRFTLLTGIRGETWKLAAVIVGKELNIEIRAYSIGVGQDWVDVYSDWEA
ncbi:uncharacterized protein PAC_14349 [Phialocephala subalpina]|uniref:FAD-binding domain-containing protein n=1 Tax=Phialocephala subalpina TaxID=576137 RepID=A0A1L7XHE3_9HELO|nr:uncharacterized protein PAC_14349 [Phialocephala subalpina]